MTALPDRDAVVHTIVERMRALMSGGADEAAVIPGIMRAACDLFGIPVLMLWVPNRDGTLSMDMQSVVLTSQRYAEAVVEASIQPCELGVGVPGTVALTSEPVSQRAGGTVSVGLPVPFPGEGMGCLEMLLDADTTYPHEMDRHVAAIGLMIGTLTALRETRSSLRRASRRLHALTSDSETVALIVRRDGVITDATGGMLLGDPQLLRGSSISDFVNPNDRTYLLGAIETQPVGEPRSLTFKVYRDEELRTVDAVLRDLRHDVDVNAYVLNIRDTTEQRSASRALLHDSRHDPLTGTLNQNAFIRALDGMLAQEDSEISVIVADVNGFKAVNDHLGHIVADDLLRSVSKRISNIFPPEAVIARIDGDSFMVAVNTNDVPLPERAKQIKDAFDSEFPSDIGGIRLSVTVGIASPTDDAENTSAESLMWQADLARFHARRAEEDFAVFDIAMRDNARRQRQLEVDLGAATREGGLQLNYQPCLDTQTGEVVGIEALVRWSHPDHGLVSPNEFIPIAETSGLMETLSRFVIRQSLKDIRAMLDKFGEAAPEYVAVNITARDLMSSGFVEMIAEVLKAERVEGRRLSLEVTESVLVSDPDAAAARMVALAEMGVKIDIDDFGTGYSSLTYLSRLPARAVKIDKSFMDLVLKDDRTMITVEAIVGLGHQLGLQVVAEGIETEEQMDWLREHHVDIAQGYLVSEPLDASGLARFLRHRQIQSNDLGSDSTP